MGWLRYFEQKGERENDAIKSHRPAQNEDEIRAMLARIDQRHERLRARHG